MQYKITKWLFTPKLFFFSSMKKSRKFNFQYFSFLIKKYISFGHNTSISQKSALYAQKKGYLPEMAIFFQLKKI